MLENVKFDKHKFTIYKATVTKVADRTFNVTGKLSHNLSGLSDDQIEYTFTKKEGEIIAASINFGDSVVDGYIIKHRNWLN